MPSTENGAWGRSRWRGTNGSHGHGEITENADMWGLRPRNKTKAAEPRPGAAAETTRSDGIDSRRGAGGSGGRDAAPPSSTRRSDAGSIAASTVLTREVLAKLRRIRIRTRTILQSGVVGSYHAVFKGRGMEFAEVREYAPGDDVRTIDWNVTARTGLPHVKKFVEERDLTLLLLVDVSGSQDFGSQFLLKRDYAAELSAVLAFAAVANHDRVGAVMFSDRIEAFVPAGRGRDHALRIVRDVLALQPSGRGTDLAAALRFAGRLLKRRGIVALLSDFQDQGYEKPLGVLRRRHDVVALHLFDPRESALPAAGLVTLRDPETGAHVVVDTSQPEVRRRLSAGNRAAAAEIFRRTRTDALVLDTSASYERALAGFFKARERRR